MQRSDLLPLRLLLEILAIVGVAQTVVMFALPLLIPGLSATAVMVASALLLCVIAVPLLLWRFSRANRRIQQNAGSGQSRGGLPVLWIGGAAAVGLLVSVSSAYFTYHEVKRDSRVRFIQQVDRLEADIVERFKRPTHGINGLAGFFNTKPTMDKASFQAFWAPRNLAEEFPGVRSFGFVEPVARADMGQYQLVVRTADDSDYTIKTSGQHPDLYVVRYLATTGNAKILLGTDVNVGPVRQAALRQAIDSRQTTLSGVVGLVPQNGVSKAGAIYFKPVFQRDAPLDTLAQRTAGLRGLVYSSIVLEELLAPSVSFAQGLAAFELLDGSAGQPGNGVQPVVFDSEPGFSFVPDRPQAPREYSALFADTRELEIAGHTLSLLVRSTPAFESTIDTARPFLVGGGGLVLTLLLTLAIWVLTHGRQQAEKVARFMESKNDRLGRAVQLTNNAVILTNAAHEIEWVNAAFSRFSGFSEQESIGKNPAALRGTELTDPQTLTRVREALGKGEDIRVQTFQRNRDGREYWMDTDIQVLRSDDGQYAGYLAVETDITDAKRAAAELQSAMLETRALMDAINTHAIVSETDAAGRITHVNAAFCRVSGYSSEELVGQNHRVVSSAIHSAEFWRDVWRTISAGKSWRGQICDRAKDGHLYWADSMIAPFMGDDGHIEKYVSFRFDITEQKFAEAALQSSAVLLEASQAVAKVGGWELDLRSGKLFWTAETYRIHETSPQEFDPTVDAGVEFYLPQSKETLTRALDAAISHGKGYDFELQTHTTKGRQIDVRTTCTVAMENGKAVKLTGIFQDITERKDFERSLHDAREVAELASRSKGQFLANMSHEIRTPMNAILGMLKLMEGTDLSQRQLDYASKASGAARTLLVLINDILDFSKVEAGKMQLDPEPFRLDRMLRDLSVVLSTNVGGKGVEVLYDIDPRLPQVLRGDWLRLQQVLVNLGGNAVKFTAQGQVVISVRLNMCNAHSAAVAFAVQDSGIGIAPENQLHIFTGFSQAEASTTRKFGGTGLGLAISQRLVKMMGGELTLTSILGVGSTFAFILDLPLVPAEDVPPELESPNKTSVPPRSVLVVDDNTIAANLTAQMALSWGWPTEVTHSGEQAIALMTGRLAANATGKFPFDVIYLDWHMTGMDGWDVARWIRVESKRFAAPQPVIVMVSSNNREALEQSTQEEQDLLNGFLVKPVTASMLQDAALGSGESAFRLRQVKRNGSGKRKLAGMRILVVEDNLLNQQVAEELLISEGALVSLAANGSLGVDAVAAAHPQFDVVLMDIQMPVMDGYTATKLIRGQLGLSSLPIVAMTANAMTSDREECLAAGMNEHVGKPFDLAQLVKLLCKIAGRTVSDALGAAPAEAVVNTPTINAFAAVLPGIDVAGALGRMGGLKSLYLRAVRDFNQSLSTAVVEWVRLMDTDRTKAVMHLHTLKGTAATVGAVRLSAAVARLESLCKGDRATVNIDDERVLLEPLIVQTRNDLDALLVTLADVPVAPLAHVVQGADAATAPAVAADTPLIRHALQEIIALLLESDMSALGRYAAAQDVLGALPAGSLDTLEEAMQSLNFPDALAACQALLQEF